ncbi:MAG: helix-turn-helix domain-containing protein [Actinomycetota bacterium]|nr:helix-turn-helix domain-containing protein [Actinomycetota bacterium]
MSAAHLVSSEELTKQNELGRKPTLIEPWIGAEELALVLNVSTDWVYEKAALGDLPSYKFGGHRRFRVSEVEDWARRHASGMMAVMSGSNRRRRSD